MSEAGQPRAAQGERRTVAALIGCATFGPISSAMAQAGEGRLMLASGAVAVASWVAMCFFASRCQHHPAPKRPGEIARMSEPEFDRLVEAVEGADATLRPGTPPSAADLGDAADDHVESIVRDALDDLPAFLRSALDSNVAVLVSDDGHKHCAYGRYFGGTVASSDYDHRIHVFRDTLVRDSGSDPEELRRQVATTVRHEVAHHLGADERHVAELGL